MLGAVHSTAHITLIRTVPWRTLLEIRRKSSRASLEPIKKSRNAQRESCSYSGLLAVLLYSFESRVVISYSAALQVCLTNITGSVLAQAEYTLEDHVSTKSSILSWLVLSESGKFC